VLVFGRVHVVAELVGGESDHVDREQARYVQHHLPMKDPSRITARASTVTASKSIPGRITWVSMYKKQVI